jgi:hypothetical protein
MGDKKSETLTNHVTPNLTYSLKLTQTTPDEAQTSNLKPHLPYP